MVNCLANVLAYAYELLVPLIKETTKSICTWCTININRNPYFLISSEEGAINIMLSTLETREGMTCWMRELCT